MTGTLINAGAVILGSIVGLLIHSHLPKKIITITFQALGLATLFIGISMALKTSNVLVIIFSIVIGAIIGEFISIEHHLNSWSDALKRRFHSEEDNFSEGLITATMLFCVGSMSILGAVEEGMGNPPNLLLAKSILDGFAAVALASSLGIGVLFSVVPLLLYQGTITFFAQYLERIFTSGVIDHISGVGGLLLIGLGFTLLEIKRVSVINMLPSLCIVTVLAYFIL